MLLPEDDLTLACVLKGPILGLDEEQLFTLAYGRAGGVTLWRALREARDTDPAFAGAYALLRGLMEKADFMPPYELFNYILGPLEGRAKILAAWVRMRPIRLMSFYHSHFRMIVPMRRACRALHWMQSGSQTINATLTSIPRRVPGLYGS